MSHPRQPLRHAALAAGLVLIASPLVTAPAVAAPADDLAAALQLSLPFDSQLTDSSGHGRDASLFTAAAPSSTASYVDGVDGQAMLFNGTTALSMGTDSALAPADLTLSFWFKPSGSMGTAEQVFAWSKQAYNADGWYLSSEGSGIPLALSIGSSTGQPYKVSVKGSRDAFFPQDRYTHVVVSFDAKTKQVKIYKDGRAQSVVVDQALSATAAGEIKHASGTPSTLGFNGPQYKGSFLNGALDDYRIYSTPVDDAAAVGIYQEHEPGFDPATVAKEDLQSLSIASVATGPFRIPATGSRGSTITWSTEDEALSLSGETASVTRAEDDREVTLTATASYAGSVTGTRTFTVLIKAASESAAADLNSPAQLSDVLLADPYLQNAEHQAVEYLLSLEPERFLTGFYTQAGLEPTAEPYTGWETTSTTAVRFSGHFAGHYVSALAQAYSTQTDAAVKARLLSKLTAMVQGLEKAQAAYAAKDATSAGYVSPFPVSYLPSGKDGLLVPFYNLHKVLAGLLDAGRYAPADVSEQALKVADGFGTWLGGYVGRQANPDALLRTEYGGMNEALYNLYDITRKPAHLKAAEAFDEVTLFRSLAEGKDVLDGLHANTTIPKLTGALRRYAIFNADPELKATLSDAKLADLEMYKNAAENFWQMVVDDHTYANGGNSQSEHFHAADSLFEWANTGVASGYGENSTSEGCNEYNMLKLSTALFQLTGEVKYADYYEETFINTILASQNPETGMVTYFQPMTAGYAKVFGHPEGEFWCDHGSGIESFTKLGDGIYFSRGKDVIVNRYSESTLQDSPQGIVLEQRGQVPAQDTVTFKVSAAPGKQIASGSRVKLRVPKWIDGAAELRVNGALSSIKPVGGYLTVPVSAGDVLELKLTPAVRVVADEQNENWVAFKYGPTLLATELNRNRVDEHYRAGVGVKMGTADKSVDATVVLKDAAALRADPSTALRRIDDAKGADGNAAMRFTLAGHEGQADRTFEPYFSLYEARYAVYMTLVEPDSEAAQASILKKKQQVRDQETTTDLLTSFDNNNSEAGKNYQSNRSSVGVFNGRQFRHADNAKDAWFSYEMAVDQSAKANYLCVSYYGGDAGRSFDVLIDGKVLKTETVQAKSGTTQWYEQCDEIPAAQVAAAKSKRGSDGELLMDQEGNEIPVVTVRFQGTGQGNVGGVYGVYTRTSTSYSTASALRGLSASVGALDQPFDPGQHSYVLTVPAGTESVDLTLNPAVESGLVYVNDVLIDDASPRTVNLAAAARARAATTGTAVSIRSVAQDHTTSTEYELTIEQAEDSGSDGADGTGAESGAQSGADGGAETGSSQGNDQSSAGVDGSETSEGNNEGTSQSGGEGTSEGSSDAGNEGTATAEGTGTKDGASDAGGNGADADPGTGSTGNANGASDADAPSPEPSDGGDGADADAGSAGNAGGSSDGVTPSPEPSPEPSDGGDGVDAGAGNAGNADGSADGTTPRPEPSGSAEADAGGAAAGAGASGAADGKQPIDGSATPPSGSPLAVTGAGVGIAVLAGALLVLGGVVLRIRRRKA